MQAELGRAVAAATRKILSHEPLPVMPGPCHATQSVCIKKKGRNPKREREAIGRRKDGIEEEKERGKQNHEARPDIRRNRRVISVKARLKDGQILRRKVRSI